MGLRIPDADTATPQNIDLLLITKDEAVLISVKNIAGFLLINGDGSWECQTHTKLQHLPDPVSFFFY